MPPKLNKKSIRVEYIDIARVLAAFIIILYHAAIVGDSNVVYATAFLFGRLPFFYVLAGFFLRDPAGRACENASPCSLSPT